MTDKELEKFFMLEVPASLRKLDENQKALWGSLTAPAMLEHLRAGLILSLDPDPERLVLSAPEKIPALQAFVLSDRPLPRGAERPAAYAEVEPLAADFMGLKVGLLRQLIALWVLLEKEPSFQSVHPTFGHLNRELWLHLHYKHFVHHFQQFEVYPA